MFSLNVFPGPPSPDGESSLISKEVHDIGPVKRRVLARVYRPRDSPGQLGRVPRVSVRLKVLLSLLPCVTISVRDGNCEYLSLIIKMIKMSSLSTPSQTTERPRLFHTDSHVDIKGLWSPWRNRTRPGVPDLLPSQHGTGVHDGSCRPGLNRPSPLTNTERKDKEGVESVDEGLRCM